MNVVDTSAVISVLYREPGCEEIERKLLEAPCVMSAATRVELGIVVEANRGPEGVQLLDEFLSRLDIKVVPVDEKLANEAIRCWHCFGRDVIPQVSTTATPSRTHSLVACVNPCSSWATISPRPTPSLRDRLAAASKSWDRIRGLIADTSQLNSKTPRHSTGVHPGQLPLTPLNAIWKTGAVSP